MNNYAITFTKQGYPTVGFKTQVQQIISYPILKPTHGVANKRIFSKKNLKKAKKKFEKAKKKFEKAKKNSKKTKKKFSEIIKGES